MIMQTGQLVNTFLMDTISASASVPSRKLLEVQSDSAPDSDANYEAKVNDTPNADDLCITPAEPSNVAEESEIVISSELELITKECGVDKFTCHFKQLEALGDLRPGWDSYDAEPPNATTRFLAGKALDYLLDMRFPP